MRLKLPGARPQLKREPLGRTTTHSPLRIDLRPLWHAAPFLSLLFAHGLAAQDTTAYRIASLSAFLFKQTTGRIDSTDLLALGDKESLFNTITGGGLAGGSPSGATFVLVQLTGPFHLNETGHRAGPFTRDTTRSLQLMAGGDRSLPRFRQRSLNRCLTTIVVKTTIS